MEVQDTDTDEIPEFLPRLAPKLFADGVSKNFHVNLKSIVENKNCSIAQLVSSMSSMST